MSIDKEDFAKEVLDILSQHITEIELPYSLNMVKMRFTISYNSDKIIDSNIIEFNIIFNNLSTWRCEFIYKDELDAETIAKKIFSEFNEWLAEDGFAKFA